MLTSTANFPNGLVHGITTQTVTVVNPDAMITLRQDNNEGFSLTVS